MNPYKNPRVEISLGKVRENAKVIVDLCRSHGIEVAGVVKACCGDPMVAKAMIAGGVRWIADSRTENLKRIKESGITEVETILLRSPMLSQVRDVVSCADISLNTEPKVLEALSSEAARQGRTHKVIIMLDMGDLREGVLPEELTDICRLAAELEGLELYGIGTNFACFAGVLPTLENLRQLSAIAEQVEEELGVALTVVSGGNSSNLYLFREKACDGMRINQLRIGESILLGHDIVTGEAIPGCNRDAFVFVAEVVECKMKLSSPEGERGPNAFGRIPKFRERGRRMRAICASGRQDVQPDGLTPIEDGIEILGGSSDHLILDVTDSEREIRVGSEIRFTMDYPALLRSMTSPYVAKVVKDPIRF